MPCLTQLSPIIFEPIDKESQRSLIINTLRNICATIKVSYGLFVDFYWYETGDIVSIGDTEVHYFCIPKGGESVAKMRLATEEMYKLYKEKKLVLPKE